MNTVNAQTKDDDTTAPGAPARSSAQLRQRRLAPLKSGAYATSEDALRLRYRKVRRLVKRMSEAMPWLDPSDLPAARAWAELEILGAAMFVELTTRGFLTAEGEPRRLLAEYRHLRQAQLAYERELGMTPAARTALQVGGSKARALDLAGELAEGRRLRLAAEGRQAGTHGGSG